ncbi:hypothetical protein Tco_1026709, partial [Tanacetum coccineum]
SHSASSIPDLYEVSESSASISSRMKSLPSNGVRVGEVVSTIGSKAYDAALDDGVVLMKRCGYFFLNWSSRSHVNSGPLLEFHQTLTNGIRLRFNRLISRPTISTGSSTK